MSHPARRRDDPTAPRTSGGRTPVSRPRRLLGSGLSEATARRLLDGSADGPSPLPQLLAAATAPGTAAELQGEAAARAAFHSSVPIAPGAVRSPRTARAKTATAIVTAKIIAAVVLTAGTAGGVALATNSYSAHLPEAPGVSGPETTAVKGVPPGETATSTTVPPTRTPDGAVGSDGSTEADADRTVPPAEPGAPSPGPVERCGVRCAPETAGGTAAPSGQTQKQTSDPEPGDEPGTEKTNNGNGSDKAKTNNGNGNGSDKPKTNNGNGSATTKSDNGNGSDKQKTNNGKKADNGSTSGDTENAGKKDKSDPGSKQANVGRGQIKKKTDAGTTTTA